jgi:hypothetical protein
LSRREEIYFQEGHGDDERSASRTLSPLRKRELRRYAKESICEQTFGPAPAGKQKNAPFTPIPSLKTKS